MTDLVSAAQIVVGGLAMHGLMPVLADWLLDGWWKTKNDRRHLSEEQQESVNRGQWPEDGNEKN